PHRPLLGARVTEPHALEDEAQADRDRHRRRPGLHLDARPDLEKAEEIVEIEALLEDLREREQHALDQVAALPERPSEEGEDANREYAGGAAVADDGEVDDHAVRAVVAERADDGEEGRNDAPADRQALVGVVELLRQPIVPADEEIRQPEELELLG